ncbi:LytTR family DNA-binding domain-containing protein [Streptococcus lutetiensis]|uniref:LytTR family DNA-binding domain-containing protein n=1 Tax=Streptococcus lutetiensis TaxID=150055 RepID=UPI001BD9DAE5|nr:LytTR family DNA-binding domain-containing protein [Streptococcus lutetiensis]MBT0889105.1 LytTR family transcriptional regulator [Streptococcus lutetiensis]MBT0909157.1 LytTR family transcriptional regulator [Streptococcus lutetiensis]MBT0914004.1 LytTR family transcriptional regulator [Streptococcus lutetiensis]MBT0915694.1 LytTR family transcriptional regulator [Streptococcus lutetiensis]MBT0919109.1 LytTR family transcriptional regulator [Streptococcus lutetiensis]
MRYQFEEDSSLPKETIEVLVRSRKYDQAVQDVLDYLAKFEQGRVEILPVKTAVRTELLRVSDLILVDVDGTSLILETTNGRLNTTDRLYKFREHLANPDFVQVSKHALININHLKSLENSFSGNMLAMLTNDVTTNVSRRYLSDLEKALGL